MDSCSWVSSYLAGPDYGYGFVHDHVEIFYDSGVKNASESDESDENVVKSSTESGPVDGGASGCDSVFDCDVGESDAFHPLV